MVTNQPAMTRSVRSAWSFISVVAFSVVSMGLALVVTPVLLRELGAARLGAARAVNDWVGYLTLFELGLSGALMPLLGRSLAQGDKARVRATLSAGFRAYLLVMVPMLVGAGALTLAITHLVNVEPALRPELRVACLWAAVPLVTMPLAPLRALIEANQRSYVWSGIVISQSVSIAFASVLLAKAGWGIAGQTLAVAIGSLVLGALVLVDTRWKTRELLPANPLRGDPEASRAIWKLNTSTLIINACGRIGLLTDNIVIGSILSAPAIVPFLMTQRLAQIAQGQLQAVGNASWAGLAQLHARGELELFRERFLELNQIVMILGLTGLIPIVAFNHAFVRLWLGEGSYGGMVLTALASCNALALAIGSLWGWLFGGTGRLAVLVPVAAIAAAVNLAVSVGFTWFMAKRDPSVAIWGPVLGTSAGLALVNLPFTPILMRRHFGIALPALVRTLVTPLVVAAPFGVVLFWFADHNSPKTWLLLVVEMAGSGLVFALLSWMIAFSAQERARWLHRLRLIIGIGEPGGLSR